MKESAPYDDLFVLYLEYVFYCWNSLQSNWMKWADDLQDKFRQNSMTSELSD